MPRIALIHHETGGRRLQPDPFLDGGDFFDDLVKHLRCEILCSGQLLRATTAGDGRRSERP